MGWELEVEAETEGDERASRRLVKRNQAVYREGYEVTQAEVVVDPPPDATWWAQWPDNELKYTRVLDRRPEGTLVATETGSELITPESGADVSPLSPEQIEQLRRQYYLASLSPSQRAAALAEEERLRRLYGAW